METHVVSKHVAHHCATRCDAITSRIAQSLNLVIRKLAMEAAQLGETSETPLKGSDAAMRWFFTRIHTEENRKILMETLFSH